MESLRRTLRAAGLAALVAFSSHPPALAEWAVVNRPCSPLLDRPGAAGEARELLYPGMRVCITDMNASPGYVRATWGEKSGFMRAGELLRGFIPEDRYPGEGDRPEPGFLESDRNGNGIPDFREIVYAARDMLGLPFDDAASLRLDDSGQTPDGLHSEWAHDGRDNNGDGVVDDRDEDVLVCIDLLIRALEAAGYPMTKALREAATGRVDLFNEGAAGSVIRDEFMTRRVRNVVDFVKRSPDFKYFPEPEIHQSTAFPKERARPGDLLFFGLTKDLGHRKFKIQHSAICVSVNPATGLPVWMITAVVPRVQFFNLEKGYHRFVYCGHARLQPVTPGQGSPSVSALPEIRKVAPLAQATEPPAATEPVTLGPYALPSWAVLAHPSIAGQAALPAAAPPAGTAPVFPQPLAKGATPGALPVALPSWPFAIANPFFR